jgi:hypothetical protein
MLDQGKLAVGVATFAWGLMAIVPVAVLTWYPGGGLTVERVAFFGFILGAVIWIQTVFSADAPSDSGFSNFSLMLSCVAMGAFLMLVGSGVLTQDGTGTGDIVLTESLQLSFVGLLLSFASAHLAVRTLKASAEPARTLRLLSLLISTAVFVFFVALLAKASGA